MRLTITVDPCLMAYAEHLVESRRAASTSAAFTRAITERAYHDRRRRSLSKAKAEQADPGRVARVIAHIDQQLAQRLMPALCPNSTTGGNLRHDAPHDGSRRQQSPGRLR